MFLAPETYDDKNHSMLRLRVLCPLLLKVYAFHLSTDTYFLNYLGSGATRPAQC